MNLSKKLIEQIETRGFVTKDGIRVFGSAAVTCFVYHFEKVLEKPVSKIDTHSVERGRAFMRQFLHA